MERERLDDGEDDDMTRVGGVRRQQPRRVFRDRREAGQVLAALLDAYRGKPDVIVLGLARGVAAGGWKK